MSTYPFKDDNGKVHQVSFEDMMLAEDGFLTRPNGEVWRRVNDPSSRKAAGEPGQVKHISDSMGFTDLQLSEMQDHLKTSGVQGIEFRQDPSEPTYVQVVASSAKAMAKYRRARGFEDYNSRNGSGAMIDKRMLENARKLVLRSCKPKK